MNMSINHKAAFKCHKCPGNNNPEIGPSCPIWWEITMRNDSNEIKVEKACGFSLMPLFFIDAIKSGNHGAQAINRMETNLNNNVLRLFESMRSTIVNLTNLNPEDLLEISEQKQGSLKLEDPKNGQ